MYKKYKRLKKSLNKKERRDLRNQIYFLTTAMICEMSILQKETYSRFCDEHGWAEFYEEAMTIAERALLDDDSEFIKFCRLYYDGDPEAEDYFQNKHDTCTDWYFMNIANEALCVSMKGWEVQNKSVK